MCIGIYLHDANQYCDMVVNVYATSLRLQLKIADKLQIIIIFNYEIFNRFLTFFSS